MDCGQKSRDGGQADIQALYRRVRAHADSPSAEGKQGIDAQSKGVKRAAKPPENPYAWVADTVAGMLGKKEYLLHTVNFKTYRKSYKNKKKLINPEENQTVFENTHPAIIEQAQWERVQELWKNKRRPNRLGKDSMFSGLLVCADCGAKLYFCTTKHFKSNQDFFVCSGSRRNVSDKCTPHFIRSVVV